MVEDAESQRLEHDGVGEAALDRQDRRPGEVQLALAVAPDRAGEAVVLEIGERLGIHDVVVAQEAQLVVSEAELAQQREQAAGAGHDAEAAASGQSPGEQFEHTGS